MHADWLGAPVHGLARGDSFVEGRYLLQLLEEVAVGAHFDHVHVLIEGAGAVLAGVSDTPDHPDLLAALTHGFKQVGVSDPYRIHVEAALVRHRGHEDW